MSWRWPMPTNLSSICTYDGPSRTDDILESRVVYGEQPCLRIRSRVAAVTLNGSSSTCGRRGSSRVAVCMAGAARTFAMPAVYKSIWENLIGGLKADVDVFAVIDLGDALPKRQSGWTYPQARATEQRVANALSLLQPRMVARWRDGCEKVQLNERCSFTDAFLQDSSNVLRSMAQPAAWDVCMSLIEARELDVGTKYDWVVRTRPDLLWSRAHPPACALEPSVSALGEASEDNHFVLPRRWAPSVMRGIHQDYAVCRGKRPFVNLEGWLVHQMHGQTGKPPKELDFGFVIQRASEVCNRKGEESRQCWFRRLASVEPRVPT